MLKTDSRDQAFSTTSKPQMIRRSQQEWQSIFQAFEQSGLSCQAFCRAHHIAESTFYKWQAKLEHTLLGRSLDQLSPKSPDMGDFIAISTRTSPHTESTDDWAIELLIGDVTLRIRQPV